MPGSAEDIPCKRASATAERSPSRRFIAVSETRPTSCVVADDHPAVLHAVCTYLEGWGIEIVARALDGRNALERIAAQKPAVALVDFGLPGLTGAEAAAAIRTVSPATGVFFVSDDADLAHATAALYAGARGIALKASPLWELARAIEIVGAGGSYVDRAFAGALGEWNRSRLLTASERELLRLVAAGLTNDEIGERLLVSGQAVEKRLVNAMAKLGISTRTHAPLL